MPADALYTVTEIYPSHVVLDGNHPLAGMALRLDLKVRDVREASAEEIERGSVGDAGDVLRRVPPSTAHALTQPPATQLAAQRLPVEPKPPAPRADCSNRRRARKLACTTGTITSCAMRSIGCTVKAASPRFQQLTISGPW